MKSGLIIAFAIAAVLGTAWMAKQALDLTAGTPMSGDGYAAMFVGVVLTVGVGVVLMFLVFYSSRRGYDEPAIEDQSKPSDAEENKDKTLP